MKKLIILFLLLPTLCWGGMIIQKFTAASSSSHWPDDPSGAEYIYVDTDGTSGDFSSLSAAEAAIGTTGYCANIGTKPCVIVCSNTSGIDTTAVTFSFSGDATSDYPLIVRSKDPDHLYKMAVTGNKTIVCQENYTTLRGFEIKGDTSYYAIELADYRSHMSVDSCIIYGANVGVGHNPTSANASGHTISNCIFYGCYESGIRQTGNYAFTYEILILNNTVYDCNTSNNDYRDGISWDWGATNIVVKNNIAVENGHNDFGENDSTVQSYNISSDTTAVGTGSLTSRGLTDIDFISTTLGSEDLHIESTSVAKDVGTDPTGTITWDIDGDERTSTGVEVGADQL